MSTISIDLPDDVHSAVLAKAKSIGFNSVAEYLVCILSQIAERQAEIEALAKEGLASSVCVPWSKDELGSMRKSLQEKYGQAPH